MLTKNGNISVLPVLPEAIWLSDAIDSRKKKFKKTKSPKNEAVNLMPCQSR